MADLAAFGYRARDGQSRFRQARDAEEQGNWAQVADLCEAALAVDPNHLEAAYLLAVARAKQQTLETVVDPLAKAVAGDFADWGNASLAQRRDRCARDEVGPEVVEEPVVSGEDVTD